MEHYFIKIISREKTKVSKEKIYVYTNDIFHIIGYLYYNHIRYNNNILTLTYEREYNKPNIPLDMKRYTYDKYIDNKVKKLKELREYVK